MPSFTSLHSTILDFAWQILSLCNGQCWSSVQYGPFLMREVTAGQKVECCIDIFWMSRSQWVTRSKWGWTVIFALSNLISDFVTYLIRITICNYRTQPHFLSLLFWWSLSWVFLRMFSLSKALTLLFSQTPWMWCQAVWRYWLSISCIPFSVTDHNLRARHINYILNMPKNLCIYSRQMR